MIDEIGSRSHIYCPAVAPSAASSYSRPQNDAAAAIVNANNNDDDDYNGVIYSKFVDILIIMCFMDLGKLNLLMVVRF